MLVESFIEGQRYKAEALRVMDRRECIFIPSLKLNISQDGAITKMETHITTVAASIAMNSINNNLPFEDYQQKLKEVCEEANKRALRPIQLPKKTIDTIKELYDISADDNTPQGQARELREKICTLVKESGIFNL